jgi:excisionase family DNA binding protein
MPLARAVTFGDNVTDTSIPPSRQTATDTRRLFDVLAAVAHLKTIGADAATVNFVRNLISSGEIPHLKIGKKFFLSKTAMDAWLANHERRRR